MAFRIMIAELNHYTTLYNARVTDHYAKLDSASIPAGHKLLNESLNASIGVLKEKFESLADSHSYDTFCSGDDQSIHSLMLFCVDKFLDHVIYELDRRFDSGDSSEGDPEPGFSEVIDTMETIKKIALDVMDGLSDRITLRAQYGDTEPSSDAPKEKLGNFIFDRDCAELIYMLELSTYAYNCFLSLSRKWHQPIENSHYNLERSLITTTNVLKNRMKRSSRTYGLAFDISDGESKDSMGCGVMPMIYEVYYELRELHYDTIGPRLACDFNALIELLKTIETDALDVCAKLEQRIVST